MRARCSRRVIPSSHGASQSPAAAASAASARSGQLSKSPPSRRTKPGARLQIACLAAPGKRLDAELANALQHGGAGLLARHLGQRGLLQHEIVQPHHPPSEDRLLAHVPLDGVGCARGARPGARRGHSRLSGAASRMRASRSRSSRSTATISCLACEGLAAQRNAHPGRCSECSALRRRPAGARCDPEKPPRAARRPSCQPPEPRGWESAAVPELAKELACAAPGSLQRRAIERRRVRPPRAAPRCGRGCRHPGLPRSRAADPLRQQRREIRGKRQRVCLPRSQQHVRQPRCTPRRVISRPCGVMRPPASRAPRRSSRSRALASMAAGGGSSH